MYAEENHGRFPDRFEDLMLTQEVTSEVFVCPSSNDERSAGSTFQETVDGLSQPGHLSYVYVGKGLDRSAPAAAIVACEKPGSHNKDGMNFLYADGHVEFHQRAAADYFIAEVNAGNNPPCPQQ